MSDNDANDLKNPHVEETVVMSRAEIEKASLEISASKPSLTTNNLVYTGRKRELMLIVRGMVERIIMPDEGEIKLGRFEPTTRQENEIDLTPYGAMDRGVSRFHARIYLDGEQLFIIDNKSTNGTYVGNIKVVPHVATILGKGAELVLGRLPIQVMLR